MSNFGTKIYVDNNLNMHDPGGTVLLFPWQFKCMRIPPTVAALRVVSNFSEIFNRSKSIAVLLWIPTSFLLKDDDTA